MDKIFKVFWGEVYPKRRPAIVSLNDLKKEHWELDEIDIEKVDNLHEGEALTFVDPSGAKLQIKRREQI